MLIRKYNRAGTYQNHDSTLNMPQLSTDNEDSSCERTSCNRRSKKSVNLHPLKVKTSSKEITKNPENLVRRMKRKVRQSKLKGYNSTKSPNDYKLSYIFATQQTNLPPKEQDISEFLDKEGIFQIHLDMVMKEYDFSTACQ